MIAKGGRAEMGFRALGNDKKKKKAKKSTVAGNYQKSGMTQVLESSF